jgi:hypothetical protein
MKLKESLALVRGGLRQAAGSFVGTMAATVSAIVTAGAVLRAPGLATSSSFLAFSSACSQVRVAALVRRNS